MHYGECRTLCLTDVQPFLPSAFLSIIHSLNKQLLNIYDVCLPFLALAYSDTQDRPPDFMNFTEVLITILRINEKHWHSKKLSRSQFIKRLKRQPRLQIPMLLPDPHLHYVASTQFCRLQFSLLRNGFLKKFLKYTFRFIKNCELCSENSHVPHTQFPLLLLLTLVWYIWYN